MLLLPPSHFVSLPATTDSIIMMPWHSHDYYYTRRHASPFSAVADPLRAYRDGLRVRDEDDDESLDNDAMHLLPEAMRRALEFNDVRLAN